MRQQKMMCPQLETAQWFRSRRILPPRRRPDWELDAMIDLGCSSDLQPGFRPCRMDFGQQGRILIHLECSGYAERRTGQGCRDVLQIPATDQKQVAPENIAQ